MHRRPLSWQFNQAVLEGRKISTIRAKRWPIGPIQLYNWSGKPYASKQENVAVVSVKSCHEILILRHKEEVLSLLPKEWEPEPGSCIPSLWFLGRTQAMCASGVVAIPPDSPTDLEGPGLDWRPWDLSDLARIEGFSRASDGKPDPDALLRWFDSVLGSTSGFDGFQHIFELKPS